MTRRMIPGVVVLAALIAAASYFIVRRSDQPPTATATQQRAGDGGAAHETTPRGPIELDTRRQQLIGVRTVSVEHVALNPSIRLAGTVAVDETRQSEISLRVDGWIRDLTADFTGRVVRRGEPLFTLYSPDLIATQQELLLALRGRMTSTHGDATELEYTERLVAAARERLQRLDMAAEDVDQLERTGKAVETIVVRSPVSGTIVDKAAVRGMRVMAGQMLYRIADLSSVWVEAAAYETDLSTVRPGVRATVTFAAYPQRTFSGRVSFVAPMIAPDTRTARVRISLPNPGGLLKPNMLAEVSVQGEGAPSLVVPADAIVNTGTDTLAFVAEGDGRFTPRRVRIGRSSAEGVEVLSGLTHGEQVAASATFFLDSESQLRGALQNYESPVSATEGGPATASKASRLDVTFRSDPESPKPGDATLIVSVKDEGKPVTDADVSVVLSMPAMPAMNMPAMRAEAKLPSVGDGTYRGTGMIMTPGRWDVAVTVRRRGQPIETRPFALVAR